MDANQKPNAAVYNMVFIGYRRIIRNTQWISMEDILGYLPDYSTHGQSKKRNTEQPTVLNQNRSNEWTEDQLETTQLHI